MSKTVLVLGVRTLSTRSPYKSVRLINGEPLYLISLRKWRRYVEADYEITYTPTTPANDLVAYMLEQHGCDVYRTDNYPRDEAEIHKRYGLKGEDITVGVRPDEPFQPLVHLQEYIDVLKETSLASIEMVPHGDFPIRDWEWALGPLQSPATRIDSWGPHTYSKSEGILLGSPARYKDPMPDVRAQLLRGDVVRPLMVEKSDELKRPWPYQPLWIDEPGQFEKAKLIMEILGSNPVPTPEQIWQLLEDRPEIKLMANNSTRYTVKMNYENEFMVDVLRGIADKYGVYRAAPGP